MIRKQCEFIVATGRTIVGIKSCGSLWSMNVFLILMNGALVLDKRRNVIFEQAIQKETVEAIIELMPNENLEFFTKEGIMTTLTKEQYIKEYSKWDMWKKKILDCDDSKYMEDYLNHFQFNVTLEQIKRTDVLKINGLQINQAKHQQLLEQLQPFKDHIINASFDCNVFELTNKNVSKANALSFLADKNHWNEEEVAVFGDSGNDVDMLYRFVHSYAPKNANEQVKQVASEIIDSNDEYGVVNKIRELMQ